VTGPATVVQVAVQSTPRFAGSPVTTAPRLIAAPAGTDAGIAELITIFVTKDETVIVDDADLLRSVVESAVTATVFFDGTLKGAVYVVVPPLAVCAGEKVPQLGALPQSATQSTPAFATSLLTVADT
jgi:hypothetical protein